MQFIHSVCKEKQTVLFDRRLDLWNFDPSEPGLAVYVIHVQINMFIASLYARGNCNCSWNTSYHRASKAEAIIEIRSDNPELEVLQSYLPVWQLSNNTFTCDVIFHQKNMLSDIAWL